MALKAMKKKISNIEATINMIKKKKKKKEKN